MDEQNTNQVEGGNNPVQQNNTPAAPVPQTPPAQAPAQQPVVPAPQAPAQAPAQQPVVPAPQAPAQAPVQQPVVPAPQAPAENDPDTELDSSSPKTKLSTIIKLVVIPIIVIAMLYTVYTVISNATEEGTVDIQHNEEQLPEEDYMKDTSGVTGTVTTDKEEETEEETVKPPGIDDPFGETVPIEETPEEVIEEPEEVVLPENSGLQR